MKASTSAARPSASSPICVPTACRLPPEAIAAARSVIGEDYGARYVPARAAPLSKPRPRTRRKRTKRSARPIWPAGRPKPKRFLDADQAKLYELIWLRTVASQMESAELERTTVDIAAKVASRILDLRATGTVVKFDGFLTLYQEGQDEDPEDEESRRLPEMSRGEPLTKRSIAADQHFTEPPPRYSEASLVKRMEELGIGRPSTYASILQVLKDRKYVRLDKRRLIPEDRGRIVVAFLESFFAKYVEYDFTADLEEKLDLVSNNEMTGEKCCAISGRDFIGADRRDQGSENLAGDRCARRRCLAPHLFPPRADGSDPRVCPTCGTGRLGA